jgi:hypothetical protein
VPKATVLTLLGTAGRLAKEAPLTLVSIRITVNGETKRTHQVWFESSCGRVGPLKV